MLTVISTHEMPMAAGVQRRAWEAFLKHGSSHSANASTLPYFMRRCEQEKISYQLRAAPGVGYYIEPRAGFGDNDNVERLRRAIEMALTMGGLSMDTTDTRTLALTLNKMGMRA